MSAKKSMILLISLLLFISLNNQSRAKEKILQEMSWVNVQEYLKTDDMVIIPLGSTEQHGPHLPLGTDFYQAFEMCKMVSDQTGVVVAPVLLAGYSVYHSGFPGTLSLKPETMEQVLFETAEMLIKYGFRKIMFFNYHGGNNIVQQKVIHRINHTTEAVAIAIGLGGPIQKSGGGEFFDWHAGKGETSNMLYVKPDLVRKYLIKNPKITFTPRVQRLYELSKNFPELSNVAGLYLGVPVETKKGGASHELSSNGIWSFSDVKSASKELGEKNIKRMVNAAVKFINAWWYCI